ncbi:MAG: hypothetical protein RRY29_05490 [Desulfovibrionaceae bacterium]
MNAEKNNAHLPAVPTDAPPSDTQKVTIITPEVVEDSQQGRHAYGGDSGTHFSYATWNTGGVGSGGMVSRDACLPGMITLLLAAVCAVHFGVLSAIGFLVFYAMGSAVGFLVRVRSLMQGQVLSPWIFRVGAWGGAALLVTWLSDGL